MREFVYIRKLGRSAMADFNQYFQTREGDKYPGI